ncbi:hypothetical protein OROMI_022816 [Orobanche minor]
MLRLIGVHKHILSAKRLWRCDSGSEREPSSKRRRTLDSGRLASSKEDGGPRSEPYCSDSGCSTQANSDANVYRQWRGIKVKGPDAPYPIKGFRDTPFPEYVVEEISKAGFLRPTPLQSQVWPIVLTGSDVYAVAPEGSGKKLAFLLPAMVHAQSQPKLSPGDGPIVLVLTDFFVRKIHDEYTMYCGASQIKSCFMEVASTQPSLLHMGTTGVEMLITTPDILKNNLEVCLTSLKRVTYLVVDHATEMLNDPDLRYILSMVRVDCQKLFFSAKRPDNFENLDYLSLGSMSRRVLYKVVIGSPNFMPNFSICQRVRRITEHQKFKELVRLLGDMMDANRVLIFMNKEKCDKIAGVLRTKGWPAFSIDEGKSEAERNLIPFKFGAGYIIILTASDFAARDIDLKDVNYVINYDFPNSIDDYIHRVGLIGTVEPKRTAHTFFTDANARFAKELIKLLEKSEQAVTPELAKLGRDAPDPRGKINIPVAIVCNFNPVVTRFFSGRLCVRELNSPFVLDAAISALEQLKSQRKLHFVRVLDAYKQMNSSAYVRYHLILEAVERGEVKACIAVVQRVNRFKEVIVFGLVDDGKLVKVIGTEEVWGGRACNILRTMLSLPEI